MNLARVGIVLIVLLLAATSAILMLQKPESPPVARSQPETSKPQSSEEELRGEFGLRAVPTTSTIWVCECRSEGDDAFLMRKLITTDGRLIFETMIERFIERYTQEYNFTACLDALRVSRMCG